MLEIEVKVFDVNIKAFKRQIAKLGARKIFSGKIVTTIFDTQKGDLKRNRQLLRVRKIGRHSFLTFKSDRKGKYRTHAEIENLVKSYDETYSMLCGLGFMPQLYHEKKRESYQLGKARIEIDSYHSVKPYIEIETHSEKDMDQALKKLGISKKQINRMTATEYLKRNLKKYKDIRFTKKS